LGKVVSEMDELDELGAEARASAEAGESDEVELVDEVEALDKVEVAGELKDSILKEAYHRIETYRSEAVPTDQALADIVAWLGEQDEIQETKTYRKTDITVRFIDGTQIGILLGREQVYGPPIGPQVMKGGEAAEESAGES
jgi:hypothetical protein